VARPSIPRQPVAEAPRVVPSIVAALGRSQDRITREAEREHRGLTPDELRRIDMLEAVKLRHMQAAAASEKRSTGIRRLLPRLAVKLPGDR
jgi:hypothetical protein